MNGTRSYLAATSALSLLMAGSAWAQPGDRSPGAIEEIVVTARKTEESLQSTPVAVTATTGAGLEKAQVGNVSQLQRIAPGLIVQPATSQPGSAGFTMRGQGTGDGLIAVDPAIGVYVDGVYVARSSGGLLDFVDMERVEVLRGPQGTLFGRNTTGGAINLISKKPTDHFEGMVRAGYGNYGAWEATGVLNVPVVADTVSLRGVYQHHQHDGYGFNAAFNQPLGWEKTDFLRGSLLVAPKEQAWSLLVQADYTNRRTGDEITGLKSYQATPTNSALVARCSGPAADARCPYKGPAGDSLARYAVDVIGKGNFYTVYQSMPNIYGDAKTGGVSATIDYDLSDDVSVKGIAAWRRIKTDSLNDNDGTPYSLVGGLIPGYGGNFINQDQYSAELQINGSAYDDRLKWIGGVFLFSESGHDLSRSHSVYPLGLGLSIIDADVDNKSYAAYGQFTYNILPSVRLTAGLRYTKDDRKLVRRNRTETPSQSGVFTCGMAASTLDVVGVCRATNDAKFDYPSYTLGVDWRMSGAAFLYAKTSRVSRSGGFNTRATVGGTVVSFQPERVTDYEVGGKFDLLDRRMRLNVAAFYSDYQNIQRAIPVVIPGNAQLSSGIQNAATGNIKGLEVELTLIPVRGLELSASSTLLDTKYTRFTIPTSPTTTLDVSDTPFFYSPKYSYVLGINYTIPAGAAEVELHADYAYRGSNYSFQSPLQGAGLYGQTFPDTGRISGYGLLSGQVALRLPSRNVELSAYGRNILQKKYYQRFLPVQDTALGITAYLPGDPRTYGMRLTYRF